MQALQGRDRFGKSALTRLSRMNQSQPVKQQVLSLPVW